MYVVQIVRNFQYLDHHLAITSIGEFNKLYHGIKVYFDYKNTFCGIDVEKNPSQDMPFNFCRSIAFEDRGTGTGSWNSGRG